jgi:hypothetical protein
MTSRELNLTPGDDDYVILPPQYQEYLDGVIQMNRRDFEYISRLLERYGLTGEADEEVNWPSGKMKFFLALGELHAYGEAVRSLDRGFSNEEPVFTGDAEEMQRQYDDYVEREKTRPSARRLDNLAYLFLHVPKLQQVYLQMQAEKMVNAFPDFITALDALPTKDIPDRHTYFEKTHELMRRSMEPVVRETFHPHEIDLLSWAIGYENHRHKPPKIVGARLVASIGNQTLTDLLEKMVDESKPGDLRTRLKEEFMDREGVGFRGMRIALRSSARHVQPVLNDPNGNLDTIRAVFDEETLRRGLCPATFKMKINGKSTNRPIALEYASTIIGKMPRGLPARS